MKRSLATPGRVSAIIESPTGRDRVVEHRRRYDAVRKQANGEQHIQHSSGHDRRGDFVDRIVDLAEGPQVCRKARLVGAPRSSGLTAPGNVSHAFTHNEERALETQDVNT